MSGQTDPRVVEGLARLKGSQLAELRKNVRGGNTNKPDPYAAARQQYELALVVLQRDRTEKRYTYWQGLAEALAMGRRGGLALETMLDLVLDSPAAIGALSAKRGAILGDASEVAFDVAGVRKDLVAMTAAAHALNLATPAGDAALRGFSSAVDAGWGARDLAAIVRFALGERA